MSIIECDNGLHSVNQTQDEHLSSDEILAKFSKDTNACVQWLKTYFTDLNRLNTCIFPKLCAFNRSEVYLKIWQTLSRVEIGRTLSYAELSFLVFGHRNGARVVGTAMKRNPFQIIVPCHRVIKSSGEYGHYAGGQKNDLKKRLIEYEKSVLLSSFH
ncbi:methylated-DNA--protein-cysteine methyltransferase-like protein [Dinothrombium tinctorium]|uniref:Methylated-DNA--protein-cysteine methyltransferase n=1 Tax=Dinothrombium tinctorium TaxID=1965070 RepID=A0A3S3P988_9ACAR|nr:methylated-DNA--protein-cysteine methyltransferase-like protein [Dinothrombium tinctorium]